MKLKYKKQQFQQDAVNALCDVFQGQGSDTFKRIIGKETRGLAKYQKDTNIYAWKNGRVTLSDEDLLKNIKKVQKRNDIPQSDKLEGNGKNLTVEMETGTGKTYTYINTIFELNRRYGWTKFIVVVPSIAIREGVSQAIKSMEDHFSTLYGKKLRHFVFDSSRPTKIKSFATNNSINIMIINNHAFNKKEKNNMYKIGENGARLIDYISGTNPIMIIDEPQKVEGKKTRIALEKEFNSIFKLRYSATHRDVYNMVYRLDALDAFNKNLVKRINVKGIDIKGTTATNSYIYFEGFDLSQKENPKARLEIEVKQKKGTVKKSIKVSEGDDLFTKSGKLQEYKGYKISEINANSNFIKFINGFSLNAGNLTGEINEQHRRRIQIRETIKSHLEKERDLYKKGIKVISLFFVDEVKKYRDYDENNNPITGKYAKIFEEEYEKLVGEFSDDEEYMGYLETISPEETHEGYFSIDKKGNLRNPEKKGRGTEKMSDDVSAYELIMNRKEQLLSLKEKRRFIFSHSALREGWDNPNVFQICVLRNTDPKEVKTRQEVGRGLRLCVNQKGERVDEDYEGLDFSNINILTIVANDSYEDFANRLQNEYYENISERPSKLTEDILLKKRINGEKISRNFARKIEYDFIQKGYVDEEGNITDKYHKDKEENKLEFRSELEEHKQEIINIVKEICEGIQIRNENDYGRIPNKLNENFDHPEFRKLWNYINTMTTYTVDFPTEELIEEAKKEIDEKLDVVRVIAKTETGKLKEEQIEREKFKDKKAFVKEVSDEEYIKNTISNSIRYDLVGRIESETHLTRKTIVEILSKIKQEKFKLYEENPEDFIIKVSNIINDKKASIINENVVYHPTNKKIGLEIFEKGLSHYGKSKKMNKYIYDYIVTDSDVEHNFAKNADISVQVRVFSKIPKGEYNINTPVGNFSPDWIIIFDKNKIKYAYFVVETKGDTGKKNLREVEDIKIKCAKKHFKAISSDKVRFDAVENFEELQNKVFG